jgi:hypothetical protein
MQRPTGKNLIILLTAIVVLIVPVVLLEINLLRHTGGNITFPFDDAYLDISTARSLAYDKVWGISKYAFQSATSSLLYPILLACIFVFTGAHLIIPIIVNTLSAIVFLFVLQRALIRQHVKPMIGILVLFLAIFLIPLPMLIVSGTGYILQLPFCLLFMETLATAILKETRDFPRLVYIYAALAVAAGIEDLLLVLLACVLLASINRTRQAVKLVAFALVPIAVFGGISVLKGSYFLPTPLVLRPVNGYLVALTIGSLVLGILLIRQFHQLTKIGTVIDIRRLSLALFIVMTLPFIVGNLKLLWNFKQDSIRVYEQQYLLAAFVHRYYRSDRIGVNDIGAVAYFSNGKKLDFTGLVNSDVAKSKKEHSWGPHLADSLSRKYDIVAAIVSEPWFTAEQLPSWNKVACWELPDTPTSGSRVITFYTIHEWNIQWLRKNLHDFQSKLPDRVKVLYY